MANRVYTNGFKILIPILKFDLIR